MDRTIEQCRGSGGEYDCLVNLSGGKDSCLLLYKLKKEYGLNVLAFTTDMNIPDVAWKNIRQTVELVDVPHVSFRPPTDFYKRMFRFLLSHQEARGAVRTVCYICAPLFEGYSLRVAMEKKIPVVFAGYAPGQPEPDRMEYEFSREILCNQDWTPPELVESGLFSKQELSLFWNPFDYEPEAKFPRYIAPFHAWEYSQEEAIDTVVKLGLIKNKKSASPIHSNCPINWLLMYSDLKNLGYNPYAPEFSKLIREGKASRNYWRVFGPIVDFMIRKKILLGRNVAKSLSWLGMQETELAITRESQGAEYGEQFEKNLAHNRTQPDGEPDLNCPNTVVDIIKSAAAETPKRPAVGYRDSKSKWQTLTWQEYEDRILKVASALRRLGVSATDHIAIIGKPHAAWGIAEAATHCLQAVSVGLDANNIDASLKNAHDIAPPSAYVIIGDVDATHFSATDKPILELSESGQVTTESTENSSPSKPEQWLESIPEIDPKAVATVVFTSGTTGIPKGICYSHEQVIHAVNEINQEYPLIQRGESTICWLPMNHLFQRMTNFVSMRQGATIYHEPNPHRLPETARQVNPTILFAVPRFIEKISESIDTSLEKLPKTLKAWIERAMLVDHKDTTLTQRLARKHIRKRLTRLMGDKLRYIVSGSAPLDPVIAKKMQSVGWTVLEAYGVTENIVPMAANRVGETRLGTVGKPFPSNTIKINNEGEILVKSPGCIEHYLGDPNSLLDDQGFYATGDLGHFDDDGYLVISGRKDNRIKTSTGRKIIPEKIENVYRNSDFVSDIVVLGHGRKKIIGIITVTDSFWNACQPMFPNETQLAEISTSEAAKLLMKEDLSQYEGALEAHERVADFVILDRAFDVNSGELTPTLKKRRAVIEDNHSAKLASLDADNQAANLLVKS